MKNFKRSNLTTALLTIFLLAISTNQAQANMFNKFRKGFYFEKYKTAEEATNALLELHPIGSDVGGLVKTLEGAGAKLYGTFTREDEKKNPHYGYFSKTLPSQDPLPKGVFSSKVKIDNSAILVRDFKFNVGIINQLLWKVYVWTDNDDKIIDFIILKEYVGL
jgi:hypothetical protein